MEKRIYLFMLYKSLQMIVGYPEIFQGCQVIDVGRNPSALSQDEGVDVTETVGIVVDRFIEHLLSQFDGLFGTFKHLSAGLQFL